MQSRPAFKKKKRKKRKARVLLAVSRAAVHSPVAAASPCTVLGSCLQCDCTDAHRRNLRLYDRAESGHEGCGMVAVLEENPLMLFVQGLKNELFCFGCLAPAQGDDGHLRWRSFQIVCESPENVVEVNPCMMTWRGT